MDIDHSHYTKLILTHDLADKYDFDCVLGMHAGKQKVLSQHYDLILLGLRFEGSFVGLNLLPFLKAQGCKVIIYSSSACEQHICASRAAGANGYVIKGTGADKLTSTIEKVLAGEKDFIPPNEPSPPRMPSPQISGTNRPRQITSFCSHPAATDEHIADLNRQKLDHIHSCSNGAGLALSGNSANTSGNVNATALAAWVNDPPTCTWSATGAGGTAGASDRLVTSAFPPSAPIINGVIRNPVSMVAGSPFTVAWSTSNATSMAYVCVPNGGSTGYTASASNLAASGNISSTALAAWAGTSSICTWTATGAGGTTAVYRER